MQTRVADEPFIDAIRKVAVERSEHAAIDDLTYGELWTRVGRVASALAAAGVAPGERVVLYCENRLGFVLTYLATLRLGATAVPTNVLYRARDLGNILEDARPVAVVCSDLTREHVPRSSRAIDVAELERLAIQPTSSPAPSDVAVAATDIAVIVYTSGTTGRAKGAMLTHGNLAAIASQVTAAWRWTSDDTLLLMLPLFHVHGLAAGLNGTLFAGAHVLLRERFDAQEAIDVLQSGAATMFFGVPTMYVRFIEKIEPQSLRSVRLFVSGSAALPADVHVAFEQRFGASILERYGSTEFGFPLGNRYEGPREIGSVGIPMNGVSVALVEPGTTRRVIAGEVGELLVAGPNVSAGYWERPDANAESFVEFEGRRWFRSGDSVRFDSQRGVFVIMGRLKELIISGGFNVYPLEVEAEMRLFPGVRDCALVAQPDPGRGEIPVAFIEAEPGFASDAFLAAMRERLASFKLPKAVYVVDTLPRNALGKVEKKKLIETLPV